MAIIDMVRWAPQEKGMIYAWRFPETNLSTYTQLVVNESQEAVLFSKGALMGKFGPGKHVLSTENLPILRSLFGIPFGGKNPFTAEVWFVNKGLAFDIHWDISRMSMHDPDYNTQLPLTASGQYGLKIVDSEKFLVQIVGTRSIYTEMDMTRQFEGEINTKVKSMLLQFMIQNKVGYKQVSAFLADMSDALRERLISFWAPLGVELTKFYVSSIDIDDSTPDGAKVKQAIGTQSSMSITGHTWQQEAMFGTANNAIGQMGNFGGGSMLGGLMAISMMNGMNSGGMSSGMMNPQYQQPTFGGAPQAGEQISGQQPQQQQFREVYCSNCSKKFPNSMAFCPHCGNKYNPCPKCGADNSSSAKRCISCGTPLMQSGTPTVCPKCKAQLPPDAAFCGNCGTQLQAFGDKCARCGATLPPGVKFCPTCGMKR